MHDNTPFNMANIYFTSFLYLSALTAISYFIISTYLARTYFTYMFLTYLCTDFSAYVLNPAEKYAYTKAKQIIKQGGEEKE